MGVIARDDSVALQPLDTLYAGRDRQAHRFGQIGHGHAAITLQQIENMPIQLVERVNRITLYPQGFLHQKQGLCRVPDALREAARQKPLKIGIFQ